MDPTAALVGFLQYMGWGVYVPVVLAGIGFFSVVAPFYPSTWPGAAVVHKLALLVGRATPAVPAGATVPTFVEPTVLPSPVAKTMTIPVKQAGGPQHPGNVK